jgi:putative SOS response-associated peptidase YedK
MANGCAPARSSPGEPNEFLREIHTRMPVIQPEEQHDAWSSGEAGKEILVPYPADRTTARPVSPRANSPKNNDPEIILPIGLEAVSRSENSPRLF